MAGGSPTLTIAINGFSKMSITLPREGHEDTAEEREKDINYMVKEYGNFYHVYQISTGSGRILRENDREKVEKNLNIINGLGG